MVLMLKFNRILLISISLLIILTLGTVSAADLADEPLAVDEMSDVVVESPQGDVNLAASSDNENLADQPLSPDNYEYNVTVADTIYVNENKEVVSWEFPDDATGTVSLYINGTPLYYNPFALDSEPLYYYDISLDEGGYEVSLCNLGLEVGDKLIMNVIYSGDETYGGFNNTYSMIMDYNINIDVNDPLKYGEDSRLIVTVDGLGDEFEGDEFTVWMDSAEYVIKMEYNEVYLGLYNLSYGKHEVIVYYPGGAYPAKTVSREFTVCSYFEFDSDFIEYGENSTVKLSLPEGAQGDVLANISGTEVRLPIVDNIITLPTSDLDIGQYDITLSYTGSDYEVEDAYQSLTVRPAYDYPNKVEAYSSFVISIDVPSNHAGTFICEYGDKRKNSTLNNGHAEIVIDDYKDDVQERDNLEMLYINIIYMDGDEVVDDYYIEIIVMNSPRDPEITTNLQNSIFKYLDYEYVSINFPILASGNANVYIDDELIEESELDPDSEGTRVYMSFAPVDYDYGNHTFKVVYSGDDYYKPANKTFTFNITYFDIEAPEEINLCDSDGIRAILPEDATGFVTVYIDGVKYEDAFVDEGIANVILENLTYGPHTFNVVYCGDENYQSISKSGTFNVTHYYVFSDVPNQEIYGDDVVISYYFYHIPNDGGIVNLWLKPAGEETKKYTATIINQTAEFVFSDLKRGGYDYYARFEGDDICPKFELTDEDSHSFSVIYKIDVDDYVKPGENLTVCLKVAEDVEGNVSLIINEGEEKIIPIVEGMAYLEIPASELNYGENFITATYVGDTEDVYGFNNYVYYNGELKMPVFERENYGVDLNITVLLPSDAEGRLIVTDYIEEDEDFVFNGEYSIPLVGGKASFSLSKLIYGYHYVKASVELDDEESPYRIYDEGQNYLITPLVSNEFRIEKGADEYANVTPLPNGANGDLALGFIVDEDVEYWYNVVDGKVSLSDLNVGFYQIIVAYENDTAGFGSVRAYSGSLIVDKIDPMVNISVARANEGINVCFPEDAGGSIIVTVGDDKYFVPVKNGTVFVPIADWEPGEYPVTVQYSGDDYYCEFIKNTTLVVPEITTKESTISIVKIANKMEVTAILRDVDGNPISGAKILYSLNGANATEFTTDDEGKIVVTGDNGLLKFDFAGDAYGFPTSTEFIIENLKPIRQATDIDVENQFTRYANDYNAGERGSMFYFTLKDGDGNIMTNKPVKIGINGVIYSVVTDSNGQAGLQINLAKSTVYTYAIAYLGDDDYNASFAVSKLNLVKKPLTITPKKTSYTFKSGDKNKYVEATLTTIKNPYDNKMYLSQGKKVTLTINGKTYTVAAGKNGAIKFNIGSTTKKGTYKVTINYVGDATYEAATSKQITIKIS